MYVNIQSERAKQNARVQQIKIMTRLENIFIKELGRAINAQYLAVAKSLSNNDANVDPVINSFGVRIRNLIERHYRRVTQVFGKDIFKELNEPKKIINQEIGRI